jgi:hypothetical protein
MIKAVAAGLAVDIGGSLVAYSYLSIFGTFFALASGGRDLLLASHAPTPPWIRISVFVIGTAFSLLGGYVAGKLHAPSPLRAGVAEGVAGCIIAIPFYLLPGAAEQGAAWNVLALAAALLGATVGGALASLTEGPRAA